MNLQKIFLFFSWVYLCLKVGENDSFVWCNCVASTKVYYPVHTKPILREISDKVLATITIKQHLSWVKCRSICGDASSLWKWVRSFLLFTKIYIKLLFSVILSLIFDALLYCAQCYHLFFLGGEMSSSLLLELILLRRACYIAKCWVFVISLHCHCFCIILVSMVRWMLAERSIVL